MKKAMVLALLLTTVTVCTRAQFADYYYHRVGDTIEWKSEIGYYSWWEWQLFYENQLPMNPDLDAVANGFPTAVYYLYKDSSIFLQRYYTPVPLKIIGVAGVIFRGTYDAVRGRVPREDAIQEYFLVYDAIGDSFPLVAQVPWHALDTMRTLHIQAHPRDIGPNPDDTCCSTYNRGYYFPLKEYYLDSAIYVMDSFYVGSSVFGRNLYDDCKTWLVGGRSGTLPFCREVPPCDPEMQDSLYCMPIGISYKVKGYSGPDDMILPCPAPSPSFQPEPFYSSPWRWIHAPQPVALMIYPIIEVDTTVPPEWACDTVQNVQATVSGTSATVTWDGFPNYSRMLLRYGLRNQPQAGWREVDVTGSTLHTLTDLSPSFIYGVTLKAECDTCKKETPWSSPLYFYVPTDSSGGQGIGEGTTTLSRLTFMQPNPARDKVTVTSSFNLTAIDLWTADGVMVYHGMRSGHEATVDVSWLRAGTYIVAIHTHNGTTHKRLLIAR